MYVLPYDINTGFVPSIRFALEPMEPGEELEEFHNPAPPEREHWEGLLNGAKFDNETAARVWEIILFSLSVLKHTPIGRIPMATLVLIGTLGQLLKLAAGNPWLRKVIGNYITRTFGPVVGPIAERVGLRGAGAKMNKLAKVPAVRDNPVAKSVVQSGAMGLKAMSMQNRLMVLDRGDLDLDVDLQELDEFLRRDRRPDMRSRGPATGEEDMPYNRRTGQWYPARRRGGYSRGGYSRGYNSRRGYGGYPSRRRRSYRRW